MSEVSHVSWMFAFVIFSQFFSLSLLFLVLSSITLRFRIINFFVYISDVFLNAGLLSIACGFLVFFGENVSWNDISTIIFGILLTNKIITHPLDRLLAIILFASGYSLFIFFVLSAIEASLMENAIFFLLILQILFLGVFPLVEWIILVDKETLNSG